jgi:hypothetical protein
MINHKQFYSWLEGYLYGKLENKHIDITPIVEKMGEVKDDFDLEKFSKLSKTQQQYFNPISVPLTTKDDDDLGKPHKIVMKRNWI